MKASITATLAPLRSGSMDNRIHNEPSNVTDEVGQVDQDGPDGVSVSFKPAAAIETGHRLIEKGLKAEREKSR